MIQIFPSKCVRKYLVEKKHIFTDYEMATIIWNSKNCLSKKFDMLEELAVNTDDVTLKLQIKECVEFEQAKAERFMRNDENNYVYVVKDTTDICWVFFANAATAIAYIRTKQPDIEEYYRLEKQLIIKGDEVPKVKSNIRFNHNITDNIIQDTLTEYDAEPVSCMCFDKQGEVENIYSNEMLLVSEIDEYDKNRFENAFVEIPYPEHFDKGLPVKYVLSGQYGIIGTSRDEWNSFIRRVENGLYVDYYDMAITVYFLNEKGYWVHDHINPIYLEAEMPIKSYWFNRAMQALFDYWHGDGHCGNAEIVLKASQDYVKNCIEKKYKYPSSFEELFL